MGGWTKRKFFWGCREFAKGLRGVPDLHNLCVAGTGGGGCGGGGMCGCLLPFNFPPIKGGSQGGLWVKFFSWVED